MFYTNFNANAHDPYRSFSNKILIKSSPLTTAWAILIFAFQFYLLQLKLQFISYSNPSNLQDHVKFQSIKYTSPAYLLEPL